MPINPPQKEGILGKLDKIIMKTSPKANKELLKGINTLNQSSKL